ncbi:hypothetical protein QBC46DRAFT_396768 [Diplogelasinospora grovesii]|uniref:Uncharacterized protein n=1 Tax=Diplogelasinospora grovesii TaxID=303347 RepID=A0AAN6MZT5_9PEZI|nr:hypothetical protein QBC46DRAFT_396768 [Diplogelasinospora grovesii]
MLFGGVDQIVPVVGSAGSAVLFTGLTQHLASRQHELSSEILCWILFPFLFSISVQPSLEERFAGNIKSKTASPTLSLWVVAACITIASISKAEIGPVRLYVRGSFFPISSQGYTAKTSSLH